MEKQKRVSQNVIIIMCWLVYSLSYLGRYSYNANINLIIGDYGVSKAQAGLVATFFFFSYGAGQVINGILCSRYNKKWLFPIALMISAAINTAVFFKAPFSSIKYLWLLNGFAQSCLWSGLISVISKTVDNEHMNKAMIYMSTTTCVGTVVTYGFGSLFVHFGNYRFSFIFGAAVMAVIGIIWFLIYSPSLEVNEEIKNKKSEKGERSGAGMKGLVSVMLILGFFAILHNILKDGLATWAPGILKERYDLGDSLSILLTIILPLLGIFGAVFAINLSKHIKDFVLLASVLFGIGGFASGLIVWIPSMNVIIAVVCFGVVVCMMHGINNVVNTLAPLKWRDRVDSGRVAGIMNGCAYAGSTISSYGLGKIADIGGWQMVLEMLFALSVAAVVIGIVYEIITLKREK